MGDNYLSQEALDALFSTPASEQGAAPDGLANCISTTLLPSGVLCIRINGHVIGQTESFSAINKISLLVAGTSHHVVVDVVDCPYLSSLALGALSALARERGAAGYSLALIDANKMIKDVIGLTGLSESMPAFDTLDEALAHIGGGASTAPP